MRRSTPVVSKLLVAVLFAALICAENIPVNLLGVFESYAVELALPNPNKYRFKVREKVPFETKNWTEPTMYAIEGTVSETRMDVVIDNSLSNMYYVDISPYLSSELQIKANSEWKKMKIPDSQDFFHLDVAKVMRPYTKYAFQVAFKSANGKLPSGDYKYIKVVKLQGSDNIKEAPIKELELSFEFSV